MCESWTYGCGHIIRTPCPRPKPVTTRTSNAGYNISNGSNMSNSTNSSPRRGSSNTSYSNSTSTDLALVGPISKFCNGFPRIPKETIAPCYNCILADARRKIQLERPEIEAKKEELRRHSMTRNVLHGPDGRYVDEFGNRIIAEEEYEQEFLGGYGGRQRGLTGGPGGGNGNFGRYTAGGYANGQSDYGVNGAQERRNSGIGAFAVNGRSGYSVTRGQEPRNSGAGTFAGNGRSDYGMNGGQERRNTLAGAGVFVGNGGFRGGGIGHVANNAFGPHRHDNNHNQNGNGGALANEFGSHQDGYHGNQHGGRHQDSYRQNDFGGASWGQNGSGGGGGLGHGLDGVCNLYTQQQEQQRQQQQNGNHSNDNRRV